MNPNRQRNEDDFGLSEGIYQRGEDIGFKSLLARQIDRVGFLSTRTDVNDIRSINNFANGVKALEKMLCMYTDSEFKKDKFKGKGTIESWMFLFGKLMKLMDRKNLLLGKETRGKA